MLIQASGNFFHKWDKAVEVQNSLPNMLTNFFKFDWCIFVALNIHVYTGVLTLMLLNRPIGSVHIYKIIIFPCLTFLLLWMKMCFWCFFPFDASMLYVSLHLIFSLIYLLPFIYHFPIYQTTTECIKRLLRSMTHTWGVQTQHHPLRNLWSPPVCESAAAARPPSVGLRWTCPYLE